MKVLVDCLDMKNKINTLMILVFLGALAGHAIGGGDDSAPTREYQVKAAFIYNFIKFIEWPGPAGAEADQKSDENNEPITIGIIGENPFGNTFETVTKKKIKNKQVVIKHFGGFEKNNIKYREDSKTKYKYKDADALKACQVLFVSGSESEYCKEIIDIVKDSYVLTIGENKDFLKTGGIIEFATEQKKVKFAINLIAAENAQLKIRSKLLRLAKKVIEKEEDEEENS
ncbi:MAG: hypothetical protein DRP65_01040 [Planctomycetota bacterium]|nr:MAG: hypothetical protein DRP65_01040 [Planctomycetota bacterium]